MMIRLNNVAKHYSIYKIYYLAPIIFAINKINQWIWLLELIQFFILFFFKKKFILFFEFKIQTWNFQLIKLIKLLIYSAYFLTDSFSIRLILSQHTSFLSCSALAPFIFIFVLTFFNSFSHFSLIWVLLYFIFFSLAAEANPWACSHTFNLNL